MLLQFYLLSTDHQQKWLNSKLETTSSWSEVHFPEEWYRAQTHWGLSSLLAADEWWLLDCWAATCTNFHQIMNRYNGLPWWLCGLIHSPMHAAHDHRKGWGSTPWEPHTLHVPPLGLRIGPALKQASALVQEGGTHTLEGKERRNRYNPTRHLQQ